MWKPKFSNVKKSFGSVSNAAKSFGSRVQDLGTRVGKQLQKKAKNIGQSVQLGLTAATGGMIQTPYAAREAEEMAREAESRRRMVKYMRSRMAGGGTVNFQDEKEEEY